MIHAVTFGVLTYVSISGGKQFQSYGFVNVMGGLLFGIILISCRIFLASIFTKRS